MTPTDRQSKALAFLRISIGLIFLIFAEYKLTSTQFIRHGMASYIGGFIERGCYPFMQSPLKSIVLPHAVFFGTFVSISELLIGLSLVTGALVRWASLGGLVMMLLFLFSANYPGANAPIWQYFGASLEHSILALCFVAFLIGNPDNVWTLRAKRSK
jgi:uncharacterized membrane protein YphA (DoxX/SURF4 family)